MYRQREGDRYRQMVRDRMRRYRRTQAPRYRYQYSIDRAKQIYPNVIPAWVDLEAIKTFYANCPEGYEVDHIIPLKSDVVCGLHVIENLQYLTPAENKKKGSKLLTDEIRDSEKETPAIAV